MAFQQVGFQDGVGVGGPGGFQMAASPFAGGALSGGTVGEPGTALFADVPLLGYLGGFEEGRLPMKLIKKRKRLKPRPS